MFIVYCQKILKYLVQLTSRVEGMVVFKLVTEGNYILWWKIIHHFQATMIETYL